MFVTEEVVRAIMKEKRMSVAGGAQYSEWCRHECKGEAYRD